MYTLMFTNFIIHKGCVVMKKDLQKWWTFTLSDNFMCFICVQYVVELALYGPITKAADDILKYIFFFQRKLDLIFHVNCLLADNSHEMSSLIFSENSREMTVSSAAILHDILSAM